MPEVFVCMCVMLIWSIDTHYLLSFVKPHYNIVLLFNFPLTIIHKYDYYFHTIIAIH